MLTLGVIGQSRKENEHRAPIHPQHFDRIDEDLRGQIHVEYGYGARFGVTDEEIAQWVGGMGTREELFARCDVILLPKPTDEDFGDFREGQVLWGWPHCVQGPAITQLAIDKKLTMLAWEAMNRWREDGTYLVHVFHKNNELAGYCSVLHAMALRGTTGHYGPRKRAVVISFGATARGAVTALYGLGVLDVTVVTQRESPAVASPIPSVLYGQMERATPESAKVVAMRQDGAQNMAAFLGEYDIIVNCTYQDTDAPLLFVDEDELQYLALGTLIIDVSCAEGMGFSFARPTSFEAPMFKVGDRVHYYAVDHSPSYMWDAATWEISEALLPFLRPVLEGPTSWDADETLLRAIEIRDGVICNPRILTFQNRAEAHPHLILP